MGINDAFNRVNGLQRTLAEWHWKFSAEGDGRWIMLASLPETGIVAQFAAIPTRVRVGGKPFLAGQNVDAFCLRRQDLVQGRVFERTAREFYREFAGSDQLAFLYGFPGSRHLRLGRKRLGYATPRPVAYWLREVHRVAGWRPWSRVEQRFDGAATDELWQRAAGRYESGVVRDARWVERRYVSHPSNRYSYFTAWRKGAPRARGVVRLEGEVVRWTELVWDGEEASDLCALDRALVAFGARHGAHHISTWLDDAASEAEVLTARGWERRPHPESLHFTTVSLSPSLESDDLCRQFRFAMGDSDLV